MYVFILTASNSIYAFAAGPEEVVMLSKMHPQELRDRYIQIKEDYFTLKKTTRQQTDTMTK